MNNATEDTERAARAKRAWSLLRQPEAIRKQRIRRIFDRRLRRYLVGQLVEARNLAGEKRAELRKRAVAALRRMRRGNLKLIELSEQLAETTVRLRLAMRKATEDDAENVLNILEANTDHGFIAHVARDLEADGAISLSARPDLVVRIKHLQSLASHYRS